MLSAYTFTYPRQSCHIHLASYGHMSDRWRTHYETLIRSVLTIGALELCCTVPVMLAVAGMPVILIPVPIAKQIQGASHYPVPCSPRICCCCMWFRWNHISRRFFRPNIAHVRLTVPYLGRSDSRPRFLSRELQID